MIGMRVLSRLMAATGGASAIEFALIAAFLILPLTAGAYDFGTALYREMEVGNAARAGAQYVDVNGYSAAYTTSGNSCPGDGFTCAIQDATSLGSDVAVSVGTAYCGCESGSTYTAQTISPPCTSCPQGGTTPITLAQVTATYTYNPVFTYLGFGPTNGLSLSAAATALIY
jgi:Flp pilus assembly pilin Flp